MNKIKIWLKARTKKQWAMFISCLGLIAWIWWYFETAVIVAAGRSFITKTLPKIITFLVTAAPKAFFKALRSSAVKRFIISLAVGWISLEVIERLSKKESEITNRIVARYIERPKRWWILMPGWKKFVIFLSPFVLIAALYGMKSVGAMALLLDYIITGMLLSGRFLIVYLVRLKTKSILGQGLFWFFRFTVGWIYALLRFIPFVERLHQKMAIYYKKVEAAEEEGLKRREEVKNEAKADKEAYEAEMLLLAQEKERKQLKKKELKEMRKKKRFSRPLRALGTFLLFFASEKVK